MNRSVPELCHFLIHFTDHGAVFFQLIHDRYLLIQHHYTVC